MEGVSVAEVAQGGGGGLHATVGVDIIIKLQELGCEFFLTKNFTGCERRMHLLIYLSSE